MSSVQSAQESWLFYSGLSVTIAETLFVVIKKVEMDAAPRNRVRWSKILQTKHKFEQKRSKKVLEKKIKKHTHKIKKVLKNLFIFVQKNEFIFEVTFGWFLNIFEHSLKTSWS